MVQSAASGVPWRAYKGFTSGRLYLHYGPCEDRNPQEDTSIFLKYATNIFHISDYHFYKHEINILRIHDGP